MTKIGELEVYLHRDLNEVVDVCVERYHKKWDNLIIIDGMERAGKTTLAKEIGYAYASKIGANFNLSNVFFNPDDIIEFAKNTRGQVIIWDEAAFGGMNTQWQNKVQQKLVQMLMVAGKYQHFFIFIIPSFFKLAWYLAVHRSVALIHVYSPDLISRGDFALFNVKQKKWIYNQCRKSETYPDPTFVGDFTVGQSVKIWNDDEYEARKDKAIQDFFKEEDEDKSSILDKKCRKFITTQFKEKEALEVFKISRKTYYNWQNYDVELGGPENPSIARRVLNRSLRKEGLGTITNKEGETEAL